MITKHEQVSKSLRSIVSKMDELAKAYVAEARKNGVSEDVISQTLLDSHFSAYVATVEVAGLAGTTGLEEELIQDYKPPEDNRGDSNHE